jgi:hypothetical protein
MEGGNKNKDDVHGMFIIHLPKTIYKYFLKESLKKETKLLTTTTRSSHRSWPYYKQMQVQLANLVLN